MSWQWILYLVGAILGIGLCLLLFYKFVFLRNPRRIAVQGNNIVSPADGRILRIVKITRGKPVEIEKGYFGKIRAMTQDTITEGYLITIALRIWDVHYQRAPVEGTVLKIVRHKGRFYNAVAQTTAMLATLENAHTEILLGNGKQKIKVVQIAGFLARRIVTFVKEGQKVKKGQLMGLIKLGSQVAIVLPKARLRVIENQKVFAGSTVLAEY